MRRTLISAILLCALLQACGSKGALVMPPAPDKEQKPSATVNRQN